MTSNNLTDLRSHFAFGKNWEKFAREVTEDQIQEAIVGLQSLVPTDLIAGRRIIDIGCGSGLHCLAALRLNASEVVAVDIDPDSVRTARSLLAKYAAQRNWRVMERSVFELPADEMGQFDIVYSWGVLHHTGDLAKAITCAAALVAPSGNFVVALYARTLLCRFWTAEKKWYRGASERAQGRARAMFILLYRLRSLVRGQSFEKHVAEYKRRRGMNFFTDLHDWMGGYPYQSISVAQMDTLMQRLGFSRRRLGSIPAGFFGALGIFGSMCTEYVYSKEGSLT